MSLRPSMQWHFIYPTPRNWKARERCYPLMKFLQAAFVAKRHISEDVRYSDVAAAFPEKTASWITKSLIHLDNWGFIQRGPEGTFAVIRLTEKGKSHEEVAEFFQAWKQCFCIGILSHCN